MLIRRFCSYIKDEMPGIRAFVAIHLPDSMRMAVGEEIANLQKLLPEGAIRWARPNGIHLTLKFLGYVPPGEIEKAKSVVESVAKNHPPFTFEVGTLGCFPNRRRPRVLWVGVHEPSGLLAELHSTLESQFEHLGFEREDRPFHPHLTLGRTKRQAARSTTHALAEALEPVEIEVLGQVPADELRLYRSDLKPSGAVYTVLAAAEFGRKNE
jgi:2'-5' RNA ligase